MILTIGYCVWNKVKLNLFEQKKARLNTVQAVTLTIKDGERRGKLVLPKHMRYEVPVVEQLPFVHQTRKELYKNAKLKAYLSKEQIKVF